MGYPRMFRLYALAVLTIAVVVACDSVPLTSPTGSTISLSIDRNILPLNGQTTVRAVVVESGGTPVHNGTSVTFNPSIGSVDPVEARTVNGIAVATFLAGSQSGTGFIHAFSGGARTGSGNASSGGVEVRIGSAAAGLIAVSASPSSVSQSGGTVTVSAQVLDSSNNPLPGVSVLFTTSTGSLSATTALSDDNGIARTQLTTTQTATVTATAGAAKGEARVEVSTAAAVALDVPSAGVVGVAVPMSVSPTNASGRQIRTVLVEFGDGDAQTFDNITGPVGFTHVYQRAGGFAVRATATDVAGNTALTSKAIVITRGTAPAPTLTMNPNPADVNQLVRFTVTTAAPTGSQQPVENIRVFINGELVFSTTGSSGAFTRGFSTTGTYTVVAESVDAVGNVGRTQDFLIVEP
jgi:hypothetical protein